MIKRINESYTDSQESAYAVANYAYEIYRTINKLKSDKLFLSRLDKILSILGSSNTTAKLLTSKIARKYDMSFSVYDGVLCAFPNVGFVESSAEFAYFSNGKISFECDYYSETKVKGNSFEDYVDILIGNYGEKLDKYAVEDTELSYDFIKLLHSAVFAIYSELVNIR